MTGADHSDPAKPDESYTYDINGNRTSSHLTPGPATIAPGNRLMAIGSLTFAYDHEGNQVKKTDTATGEETRLAYDHRNRLVLATVHPAPEAPATTTVAFDYDYLNRLISREINGVKTWILHDRDMPLAEFADGATTPHTAYFYSPDTLDAYHMVWREGIGERWLANDNLGSVRGIVGSDGTTLSWVDYDSFGNLQSGSIPEDLLAPRSAARFFVSSLGIYENRRRFYEPNEGRFFQEDPIRFDGGDFNLYRYVNNSPLIAVDHSGEVSTAESVATIGITLAVHGGVIYTLDCWLKTGDPFYSVVNGARVAAWIGGGFVVAAGIIAIPAPATLTGAAFIQKTGAGFTILGAGSGAANVILGGCQVYSQ